MKIYYKVGYILPTGEIQIIGRIYKDDILPEDHEKQLNNHLAAHAEHTSCKSEEDGHKHDKGCAQASLSSVEPAMKEFFKTWDETPDDPVAVALPKKEITVKEDGKQRKKMVDDSDLA